MINKDSIYTPKHFFEVLAMLQKDCIADLKNIIETRFNGYYKRQEGHSYIKLKNILGVPCITELKIDTSGELKYRSGVWGSTGLINTEGSWYNIPIQEIFNIYESIYNIAYQDMNTDPNVPTIL